jgi:hypothetical protein
MMMRVTVNDHLHQKLVHSHLVDVPQGPAVLNHSCLFQMRGIISSHLTVIFILRMMVAWRMRNHSIPRNIFAKAKAVLIPYTQFWMDFGVFISKICLIFVMIKINSSKI